MLPGDLITISEEFNEGLVLISSNEPSINSSSKLARIFPGNMFILLSSVTVTEHGEQFNYHMLVSSSEFAWLRISSQYTLEGFFTKVA